MLAIPSLSARLPEYNVVSVIHVHGHRLSALDEQSFPSRKLYAHTQTLHSVATKMLNILGLFMPMLSGGKDEYGKDVVPPLPLSVDRVMENRPLKSTAPLLRLPYEVLGNILSNVDPGSLGDLALVNSDCRQLARSRQFSSICFDYSDSTLALISLLLQEKMSRTRSGNTLGAIATNPE